MSAVPTISKEALDFYKTASSSLVTDAMTRHGGIGAWMDDIVPANPTWRLSGRVRTLAFAPKSGVKQSNLSVYSACEMMEPGDVMVIALAGARGWVMGENMAHFCMYRGIGGIVTDGRIRDAQEIRELGFPVFAHGTSARPAGKEVEPVAFDVPVRCGGAYVRPGDLLVGDADGIVLAPLEIAEQLVIDAAELMELEQEQEIAIRDGKPLSEIQRISKAKKVRKGPEFDPVARPR